MDDANRAEVDLIVHYGSRRKPWYNMCRTTSRQEFIEHMKTWIGDEFPENYTAFFYYKKLMIELKNNDINYLAPIFDLISSERQATVVQPISSNDNYVELFISVENLSISPHLSPEAFAGEFQSHLDKMVVESSHSMAMINSVSVDDLLRNDSFDKDSFDSVHHIQKDDESSITVQHVSPTTNIQLKLADHIRMIHDVCSTPAGVNFLSNMGKTGKGSLAYLSGVKGPNDRKKQIRPIIQFPDLVPKWLKEKGEVDLVVAYARETLEDGERAWWIDMHYELRTKGYTKDTPGTNPLEIPLTLEKIENGNFKLDVILTRIPGKINQQREGELFHRLQDTIVKQLHPAEHKSKFSRLVLMISCDGFPQTNTIGFSDFIQEPNKQQKTASGAE